jgi:hypothetical protein
MLGAPESPTYLVGKGQAQEAEAVATKLWGPKGPAQLSKPAGGRFSHSVLAAAAHPQTSAQAADGTTQVLYTAACEQPQHMHRTQGRLCCT